MSKLQPDLCPYCSRPLRRLRDGTWVCIEMNWAFPEARRDFPGIEAFPRVLREFRDLEEVEEMWDAKHWPDERGGSPCTASMGA
jgi:hypothetical protein